MYVHVATTCGQKKKKMARRASVENPSKKGIDPDDFHWMLPTSDSQGIFCSLCRKHSRRPRKSVVGKAVWTDVPCQSLVKHSQSMSHVEAVKMEATLASSRVDGGIRIAFQRVASVERAMLGALKCMYFLTKREIAHTTNFVPLCELGKALGALYLRQFKTIFVPHPFFHCA